MVAATERPLANSLPAGEESLRDWSHEVTNQLLGRIKNLLIRRGATIFVSTPVVIAGERLAPVPAGDLCPLVFADADGEHVCVWFDCDCDESLELSLSPEDVGVPDEGDAVLFF